jgi:membrane protease YdiL (CAAX protease family)
VERAYNYKPTPFFLAVYVATWIPWLIAAYAGSREASAPYASLISLLGVLAPAAATLFFVFTSGSDALKRDFTDRLFNWRRIRRGYALFAVLMPFAVISLSILIAMATGHQDQFALSGGAGLLPMIVLALMLAPLLEETGWHGYGVDSLRAKYGMMSTTLLFAVLWCAWHAPLVLINGTYQNELARMDSKVFVANFFVSIIPAAIIANWFYYKNSRSIAASVLLHSMLNAAAVLLNAGQVAKCIATLLYSAVAVGLIVRDRALFNAEARNFIVAET